MENILLDTLSGYEVGNAFNNQWALNELRRIASLPTSDHMFKVDSFEALDKISSKLEKSIIAIEGTQTAGDSTVMEFAQNGFSAALVSNPDERFLVGVIGANGWRGGYQEIPLSNRTPSFRRVDEVTPDSYLGYSMAVASRDGQKYIVMGAPRYKHKGLLMIFCPGNKPPKMFTQSQIGAYFGAEVCVVDLDGDSNTDLILASAPMHTEGEREGKVLVYKCTTEESHAVVSDTSVSLLGLEGQRGRFGSSLASLADLNGDGIRDVAVGAPLEDNGQGSVYIFNGRRRGINPTYSQRFAGSSVRSKLRFFGLTVAQSAVDHSGDGLPDIAVGSKGAILLLRSRPVVSMVTSVTFAPPQIPTAISDCKTPLQFKASVCFSMTKTTKDKFTDLQAKLKVTLKLDHVRQRSRAYFTASEHEMNFMAHMALQEHCVHYPFFVRCSPEDALSPVGVQVAFSFEGVPIPDGLAPQLDSSSSLVTNHKLKFKIDCGKDRVCEDNLRVDISFARSSIIEVGIAQKMSITVMVENRGENSYDTRVFLSYPPGLSYRTFTKSQGRVECTSLDSTDGVTLGKTDCSIDRPILQAGDKAIFVVQYGIDGSSDFGERVTIQASASSDNDKHAPGSVLSRALDIGVKYSFHVTLRRMESTTNYINFTAGNNNLQKPVNQTLKVTNSLRGLKLTVVILVPVRLQGKDIWTSVDSLNIQDCTRGVERNPVITDLQQTFKDNKEPDVDCSVAVCLEFRCTSYMAREDFQLYTVSGIVSSGWIEKTGLRSALFHLVSSATLEYDSKYIFYSADSSRLPPVIKIETLVEVYEEPTLTKEIIGGVVGGFILLALMTAVLIKSGFFKSEYQQRLLEAEAAQAGEAPPEEEAATAE
ncbi:integrin alpha-D-like isoform X2 [Sardina pilchardus]|uniref:integrin alpha-D-like isoform X2 n=1 Tax=Sardina pilchardus TaxID=27697 RepID=UPI002E0DEC00